MKIFYVCADRGIAPDGTKGASVHLREIATALAQRGHSVTIFAARMPAQALEAGVDCLPLSSADSLVEAARTRGTPDIVYERYSLGHEGGLEAARRLGTPFALEVNAPLLVEAARHRPDTVTARAARVEQRLFEEADALACVSEPMRRYVAEKRGAQEGVALVPNGCSTAAMSFDRAGEIPGLLAFLGHPKPWHGADLLPELLARLRAEGRVVDLLVVGGGDGTDGMIKRARELGVDEHLEITGPLPTPTALARVAPASIALAPYPPDAFFYFCPLKILDYMALGLPIVTTAQGDIPRLLGAGGLLVPPGDANAFVDAVRRLLDDPELRAALGRAGRRRVRTRFTWQHTAQKLESVFVALPRTIAV